MINFLMTQDGTMSLFVNNKPYIVSPDHVNYHDIKKQISRPNYNLHELVQLLDVPQYLSTFSYGNISYSSKEGQVYYKDKPVNNVISKRIIDFVSQKLPVKGLIFFLHNLYFNPSHRAIEELYKFLEHKFLPITEDGYFLAYKRVDHKYKDYHSGTFDNSIGCIVKMERNEVDDNANNHCSKGLHVGSIEYVRNFHKSDQNSHIIVVMVNPRDVVCVPFDNDCQKVRVCRYEVVAEYEDNLTESLYSNELQPIVNEDED